MDNVAKLYKMMVEMTIPIDVRGTILGPKDKEVYKEDRHLYSVVQDNGNTQITHAKAGPKYLYVTYSGDDPVQASEIHEYHTGSNHIPFPHDVQTMTSQDPSNDSARGSSRSVMFHHLDMSEVPIVTDGGQSKAGHSMWRKSSHEALNKGYHVYYWDGKNSNKSDHTNIDDHLDKYYGIDKKIHRMIVSKKELNGA